MDRGSNRLSSASVPANGNEPRSLRRISNGVSRHLTRRAKQAQSIIIRRCVTGRTHITPLAIFLSRPLEYLAGQVLMGHRSKLFVGHHAREDLFVAFHPVDEKLVKHSLKVG